MGDSRGSEAQEASREWVCRGGGELVRLVDKHWLSVTSPSRAATPEIRIYALKREILYLLPCSRQRPGRSIHELLKRGNPPRQHLVIIIFFTLFGVRPVLLGEPEASPSILGVHGSLTFSNVWPAVNRKQQNWSQTGLTLAI